MNALRRRDWEARVSRRAEARARVRSKRAWGRTPDIRGMQVAVAAAAKQAKESGRMGRTTRTESRTCPELSYCQRTCSGPDLRKYWAPKARHAVGNSCRSDTRVPLLLATSTWPTCCRLSPLHRRSLTPYHHHLVGAYRMRRDLRAVQAIVLDRLDITLPNLS